MGKSWKRLLQRRRREASMATTAADTQAPKKAAVDKDPVVTPAPEKAVATAEPAKKAATSKEPKSKKVATKKK